MAFSDKLNELMEQHKESGYALAKILGIGQSTIHNWKNGKAVPRKPYIDLVAKHYGVSPERLK